MIRFPNGNTGKVMVSTTVSFRGATWIFIHSARILLVETKILKPMALGFSWSRSVASTSPGVGGLGSVKKRVPFGGRAALLFGARSGVANFLQYAWGVAAFFGQGHAWNGAEEVVFFSSQPRSGVDVFRLVLTNPRLAAEEMLALPCRGRFQVA